MARLSLLALGKRYAKNPPVMQGLSLDVEDGEFVVILGPSGCGKSTLLRMVAGLETASEGRILVGERDVTGLEPKDRHVAMVFQNYALYPHMSVFDNMAYALRIAGTPAADIRNRVGEAARILELDALLARKPGELSGGQRQRVAMGRAIVRQPDVFLFDEPLSNLDARLRGQMRLEIQQLHRRLGITSLYVTHDQVEAMTLADRVVVMNKGRIEQVAAPDSLYDRPASLFVAGFIGAPAMNLWSGTIGEGGRHFHVDGGPVLALPVALAAQAGMHCVLGVRPEHLVAVTGGTFTWISVASSEMLGADNYAHGYLGDQRIVVRLPHHHRPHTGEQLALACNPDGLHLFDAETGLRIGTACDSAPTPAPQPA